MNSHDTHRHLEADNDCELDLVHHLELEEHLKTCAQCADLRESLRARRMALRELLPRFPAPPGLAGKVRAALRADGATVTAPPSPVRRSLIAWPV